MGIIVRGKAIKKIEAYAKEMGNREIGGLLLGDYKTNGDVIVKDIMLLQLVQTSSTFEIDDDALMDLTKNASPRVLDSIIGWWHSHHNMSTFWSHQDDLCFERLAKLNGVCVGVVVAFDKKRKLEERWRIDMISKSGVLISIDEIKVDKYISNKYLVALDEIKTDIKNLALDDNRVWYCCPTCDGNGYVTEEEMEKMELVRNA